MNKLKMHSPDLTAENIGKLAELFPHCVVECRDSDGALTRRIDWEALRQELSGAVVEGTQERYMLNWPGKREAVLLANSPVAKTLRPCREESVDFDNTQNLYIEGDNLDVLKLLRDTYLGKIKMIYIDPPYNTGNDFIYEDDFAEDSESYLLKSNQTDDQGARLAANPETKGRYHSDWLTMIYPRLRLAHQLLRDDGVIFISIDDNEVDNLKKLCNEAFGEDNFLAHIIWEKRFTRSNNAKLFASLTDHILAYRKSDAVSLLKAPRTEKSDSIYSNPDNDSRGDWTSVSYVNPATKEQRPNLSYIIVNPVTGVEVNHPTNAWKYEYNTYLKHVAENKLFWGKTGENTYPRLKKFLSEVEAGVVPVNLWKYQDVGTTDAASKDLEKLMEVKVFDFPKPVDLITYMIQIAALNKDSIILDFFSGSGTTAQAVMQLNAEDGGNRCFMMVQLPELCGEDSPAFKAGYKNICEIGKERIRRAGAKVRAEWEEKWSKRENDLFAGGEHAAPDVGFRVLKLDSSNMEEVYYTPGETSQETLAGIIDNVKPDRSAEDLLFQVMLDWGVALSLPITVENIHGKTVHFVDENAIAACFDAGVDEETIRAVADRRVLRAVFRDNNFATDAAKINVVEIFKQLSPATEVKVI